MHLNRVTRMLALTCVPLLALGVLSQTSSASATPVASSSKSKPQTDRSRGTAKPPAPSALAASNALAAAKDALAGTTDGVAENPSLALRDLFTARPRLNGDDRRDADRMLGRPTDGPNDPYGEGYSVPAERKCNPWICIHWVPTTEDAPPSTAWVNRTLGQLLRVWATEVGKLGFRAPPKDGNRGGDDRFDVYLANLGDNGYYGFCAPEAPVPGNSMLFSGFCVLDNDFSTAEYHAPPLDSMRVTAAHEFFHAIQFGYDGYEDAWLMEATATWMEEQYADKVNDNLQYLPHGQLGAPGAPMDEFAEGSLAPYGQWIFFEHLADQFGPEIVRQIWRIAGDYPGGGKRWSIDAIRQALALRGHRFADVYQNFAARNITARTSYPEGANYENTPVTRNTKLGNSRKTTRIRDITLRHLTANTQQFTPDASVTAATRLQVTVRLGHPGRTGSRAIVLQHMKSGQVTRSPLELNSNGVGRVVVPFTPKVARITLTMTNGSTRYTCWENTTFACAGTPLDDDLSGVFDARLVS